MIGLLLTGWLAGAAAHGRQLASYDEQDPQDEQDANEE